MILSNSVGASLMDEKFRRLSVSVSSPDFPIRWRLPRRVSKKEYRKVQKVELTWADKLMEEARQEGAEKGREEDVGLI